MRSSNIELCRICAILLVILTHSASWTQGNLSALDTCFVPSLFMRGFAVIGVDVFVFISGWFGIILKKKSILNLFYICIFYGIIRVACLYYLGTLEVRNLFIISDTTWFVISYFGLLLFAPILNRFIETTTQRQLGVCVLMLIIYQTWFGWFPALPYFDTFQNGYSFVSFCIIYLLAQYLRRYGMPLVFERFSFLFYIGISLSLGAAAFLSVSYSLPLTNFIFKYNNPLVIFSAVCFFYMFKCLQINNSAFVNYLASSTLAVLLIHEPQPFHGYMKQSFCYLRDNLGGAELVIFWTLSIISVYVFCIVIDQVRIFSYKYINQRIFSKIV